MSGRRAPVWTGVVIGLLLGLLVGTGWLLVRERALRVAAAQAGPAGQAPDTVWVRTASEAAPATAPATDQVAHDRRNAIVRATERVAPAVVSINVIGYQTLRRAAPGFEFWDRFYPGMFPRQEIRRPVQELGSGVIVSGDGMVLTNYHVVEDASEIVVTLSDGRQFPGKVIETAPDYDLALVRVEGPDLPVAPLAASRDLWIGEWAIAIGSPLGYLLADTQPTVTVGVISALNRDIKRSSSDEKLFLGMIQTDAAINPGNSGGPLVNALGEVIGINTFIFSQSGGSEGIGFAIPIERAKWLLREVRQYGHFRQAYAGWELWKLSASWAQAVGSRDLDGFLVRRIDDGSPAARAGLQPGDILREINGVPLKSVDTVYRLVYEAHVGDRLSFVAERDGRRFTGSLTFAERPQGRAR